MSSICVFLGSKSGNHPAYMETAGELGRQLALRGLTSIYGGSATGLMKEFAESALAAGGRVLGVTVQALKDRENFHQGLTELYVLPTMSERKNLMVQLADAFIALPGGIGTFEEFFEVYTLGQMGFHAKPCGLLDVNGFYSPLIQMLEKAETEGFLKTPHQHSIVHSENPAEMVDALLSVISKRGQSKINLV